jgi:hypothetical protein
VKCGVGLWDICDRQCYGMKASWLSLATDLHFALIADIRVWIRGESLL